MTVLCRLSDLEATGAKGVVLADGRDIVLVRAGGAICAYVNSCAHQGVPLEMFPDRFLDAERKHLVCTAHGARFRIDDGLCVSGPCIGKRLQTIPVALCDGQIELQEP